MFARRGKLDYRAMHISSGSLVSHTSPYTRAFLTREWLNTFVSKWVFSDTVKKKKSQFSSFHVMNFFVHPLFSHFITWGEFTYAFPRLCFRRLIWVDKAKGNNDNNDEENAKDCNTQKYCMMMLRRTGRLGSI